jgi:mono/diheme cytochrome c family protein
MIVSRFASVCGALLLSAGASGLSAQQPPAPPAGAAAPQRTTGAIERGRYLVERVAMCGECHSTRDDAGNIVAGTRFKGGPMPLRPTWPVDWPNAFPRIAGLPGYSDEQATRLLTQGAIKRDGTQLRMPMPRFRMSPQDAADVIAYLRSL